MPTATAQQPLKDRILDALPGYRQAELRHQRLMQLNAQTPPRPDLIVGYQRRIFAAADADAADLNQLRADFITDRAIAQGTLAFKEEVLQAIERSRTDMKTARLTGSHTALDFLRDELQALMADVRGNRDLVASHPATATDVINGGRSAKDWKLVEDLLARYTDLRAEHRDYLKLQGNAGGSDFATCGQIATFIDHDPHWTHRRGTAPGHQSTVEEIRTWFTAPRARSKPADVGRTNIWPTSIRSSKWLLIVADNQPWLPDADTIDHVAHTANQLFGNSFRDASTISFFRDTLNELKAVTETGSAAPSAPAKPVAFSV